MFAREPGNRAALVLANAALQIVGMPDIKQPAIAVEHIGPERHAP